MDKRLYFEATQRNAEPIENVLIEYLPAKGIVLELASGSGEHAVRYQKNLPKLIWQTRDKNPRHLASINS